MKSYSAALLAGVLALIVCATLTASPPQKDAPRGDEASAKLAETNLRVLDPVYVDDLTPTVLRPVNVGDLIEIQVSYPVAPPFPAAASVKVSSRALSALVVTSTPGQVAVLTPEPQKGVIGVKYVSAYVRANTIGQASATVTLTYPDASTKRVSFGFDIQKRDQP